MLFRHRVYDVEQMRWMQQDPIGYVDGLSTYGYMGSSPLIRLDPSGQFWSLALDVGFAAYDTYLYATDQISTTEYSWRMALNVSAVAADSITLGFSGQGQVIRGGALAIRGAQGLSAASKANMALHGAADASKVLDELAGSGGSQECPSIFEFNRGVEDGGTPISLTEQDLMNAANKPDRNGLTAAGRALQKHADRAGSKYAKYVTGKKASDYNKAGADLVSDIINDPKRVQSPFKEVDLTGRGNKAKIFEVTDSQGRTVRFTADGRTFVGLRE